MIISRSVHVAGNRIISLFLITNSPYMNHILFIHYSVDGHIGVFYVSDIMNSAEMNIGVHVSF